MGWHSFRDGESLGDRGSEGGIILLDEEHDGGARITLEHVAGRCLFAITCGVYGWMAHTRFFGTEDEGRDEFHAMKRALADLIDVGPVTECDDSAEMVAAIGVFVERFP